MSPVGRNRLDMPESRSKNGSSSKRKLRKAPSEGDDLGNPYIIGPDSDHSMIKKKPANEVHD